MNRQDDDNCECGFRRLLVPDLFLLHRCRQHSPDGERHVRWLLRHRVPVLPLHLHESVHLRHQARGGEREVGPFDGLAQTRWCASGHRRTRN